MSGLNALGKAAAVLDALQYERRLTRIAAATQLPYSTVHRILHEMAALGWVRQTDDAAWLLKDAPRERRSRAEEVVPVIGDALTDWCSRMGWPGGWVERLRPYGAARAVVIALQAHAAAAAGTKPARSRVAAS